MEFIVLAEINAILMNKTDVKENILKKLEKKLFSLKSPHFALEILFTRVNLFDCYLNE